MTFGSRIVHVDHATVEEISGHIGSFEVKARVDGKRVRWRADMICLTEENVLSLAIPEDLVGLKKFYRYNFAFFHTPQPGVYRVSNLTLSRLNAFEAGAALAAQVARAAADAFSQRSRTQPRVDPERWSGVRPLRGHFVLLMPSTFVRTIRGPIRPRFSVTTAWDAGVASAAVRSRPWICLISPTGSWRRSSGVLWKERVNHGADPSSRDFL